MTSRAHTRTIAAAAIALFAAGILAVPADAGQTRSDRSSGTQGFAVTSSGGSSARDPEHCNNVSSCNIMIAYCAAQGGDFDVEGSDGVGRPSKGTCTYND